MPNWQPNRVRVVFDHAAASAAVSELRSSAARLRNALDFAYGRKPPQQSLKGKKAAWVGSQVDGLVRAGGYAVQACLLEAARIETAADDAVAEQAERDRRIVQWDAEDLAERRAAAEAARVAEAQRVAQAQAASASKASASSSGSSAPAAAAAASVAAVKPALVFAPIADAVPAAAAVETASADSGSGSDDGYWF